jgi:hypothetical protein
MVAAQGLECVCHASSPETHFVKLRDRASSSTAEINQDGCKDVRDQESRSAAIPRRSQLIHQQCLWLGSRND